MVVLWIVMVVVLWCGYVNGVLSSGVAGTAPVGFLPQSVRTGQVFAVAEGYTSTLHYRPTQP